MKKSTKQDSKSSHHQIQQARASGPSILTLTGTNPEGSDRNSQLAPAESFEIVFAAIRERHETKTTILEQALQRSEQAQQRFWGINE